VSAERFRLVVSGVLIAGVVTSAALIATGFLVALVWGWQASPLGAVIAARATSDFGDLPARLAGLQPLAISQLGLVVLLATPVLRVAASVVGFSLERDRLYAAITLAVLGVLLFSIFVLH
jgi:uncharacterized membrane protein